MDDQNQNSVSTGGSLLIDAEVTNTMKEAIEGVHQTFAPFTHPLTDKQRKTLLRTGLKNQGFAEETASIVSENPSLVPGYIGFDKFGADYMNFKHRRILYDAANRIILEMSDGMLVAGDVFFRNALGVYDYLKEAARRGDTAAEVAFNRLKPRFEDQGRKKITDESISSELE